MYGYRSGAIDIDGLCRTSVPHIFAIGDVTAKLMLAHAAKSMGIVAAETIAGAETMELDYPMIPRATYCQPQIAVRTRDLAVRCVHVLTHYGSSDSGVPYAPAGYGLP